MSIIDTLVTDRTRQQAERIRELSKKAWDKFTDAEKSEWWCGVQKGAYNYVDWNRVEGAVEYLSSVLRSLPDELREYAASRGVAWDVFFDVPYDPRAYLLETKTDWAMGDKPHLRELERYLANVAALRNALDYDTDDLPESMRYLTHKGANAIERALAGLDGAIGKLRCETETDIDNTEASFVYAGEAFAGEF